MLIAVSTQGPEQFANTLYINTLADLSLAIAYNGHYPTSGSRVNPFRDIRTRHVPLPPSLVSQDLFSPALSLAFLRKRARRSARIAAHTYVGGDPTDAYLYCVYALVGGTISISDPYNYVCLFTGLCERLNESHAVFYEPVVCAVKTEL